MSEQKIPFADFQQKLKRIAPFVAQNRLEGPIQGLVVDPEQGLLFASKFFGSCIHFLDSPVSEKTFVMPYSVFERLVKVSPNITWSGKIEQLQTQMKVLLGSINIRFSPEEQKPYYIPDVIQENQADFSEEFIGSIDWIADYMCQDDRKVSMYGLFVGDNILYACDNIRLVSLKTEVPSVLKGTLLSFYCVSLIRKDKQLSHVIKSDQLIVFSSDSYVYTFSNVNASFPLVGGVFTRAESDSGTRIVLVQDDDEELQTFKNVLFSEMGSAPIEGHTENGFFVLRSLSREFLQTSVELKLRVESMEGDIPTFTVNGKYFIEGLEKFKLMKVTPSYIYFYDAAGLANYIVMRMVGNAPTV